MLQQPHRSRRLPEPFRDGRLLQEVYTGKEVPGRLEVLPGGRGGHGPGGRQGQLRVRQADRR